MMTNNAIYELIQKLKTQGDVTIQEADQIYFVTSAAFKAICDIIDYHPALDHTEMHDLLNKDFPVSALKYWYDVVADKIRAGQSGNFIFSVLISYGYSFYYNYLNTAIRALRGDENTEYCKDHVGAFEDRVVSIRANKQAYKLFPKPFRQLFHWQENFQWEIYKWLYELKIDRAGFIRYPLRELNGDTVLQLFKRLSLMSVTIPQEENAIISRMNVGRYVLAYLKQKVPFIQMSATKSYHNDIAVVTNNEGLLMAKRALKIPIEAFVENAVEQNVIDRRVARLLLNTNGNLAGFPDTEFAEANLRYIDSVVSDMLQVKAEQEAMQKTVEGEPNWLEISR